MATSGNAISRHPTAKRNGTPWIGEVSYLPNQRFAEVIKAAWFGCKGDATAQSENNARLSIVSYNPSDTTLLKDPTGLYFLVNKELARDLSASRKQIKRRFHRHRLITS